MPLTFLCHQAVVLPLKIGVPRATSGTALVLGSMAPDVEYVLRGYPATAVSHTWAGQLTFCLPVTLALFWVVTTLIAEPAAANAPEIGELHLEDYALVRHQPSGASHWAIVALSALVGSVSHLLLDGIDVAVGGIPYHALTASLGWIAVNVVLWVALAAITLAFMRHIGRHRLMRRWTAERMDAGSLPADAASPSELPALDIRPRGPRNAGTFWGVVGLGLATGAVLGAVFRRPGFHLHEHGTWVHIWLTSVAGGFIGLVLASAGWHVARARLIHPRGSQ